jgi:hypothetical protein
LPTRGRCAVNTPLPPTARWIGIFGRRLELGGLGRRYNRRTTTTPTSVTAGLTQADPCTGLTETDVTKIAEAMTAALADSTRTVYGHASRAGNASTPPERSEPSTGLRA